MLLLIPLMLLGDTSGEMATAADITLLEVRCRSYAVVVD
jgi:hypothetical protein